MTMEIASHRLTEFCAAYQQDFGESISADEAREMLSRLVTFYALVDRLQKRAQDGGENVHEQNIC